MSVDPANTVLYIPPELAKFKLNLFNRIGDHIRKLGGTTTRDYLELDKLPNDKLPIVGCSPQLTPYVKKWLATNRPFIYWDRGYARRVFATWLPKGDNGGYYRWHVNSFQLQMLTTNPRDRWDNLRTDVGPWHKGGRHVLVAKPSDTYCRFHDIPKWLERTIYDLSLITDRQLIVRDKESKRPLAADLENAHCLVTHGSNAAVEAVILGYPVFVDRCSAASLVGLNNLTEIESPIYPDRQPWLNALAYSQFNEQELIDGTLWRLLQ